MPPTPSTRSSQPISSRATSWTERSKNDSPSDAHAAPSRSAASGHPARGARAAPRPRLGAGAARASACDSSQAPSREHLVVLVVEQLREARELRAGELREGDAALERRRGRARRRRRAPRGTASRAGRAGRRRRSRRPSRRPPRRPAARGRSAIPASIRSAASRQSSIVSTASNSASLSSWRSLRVGERQARAGPRRGSRQRRRRPAAPSRAAARPRRGSSSAA